MDGVGGLDEVLRALGWEPSAYHRALLVGYIVVLSSAITVGGWAISLPLGRNQWVVQLALWVPWLVWLGYVFPRSRQHSKRSSSFRRPFFTQVGPGISWNFAQMARPGLVATAAGGFAHLRPWPVLLGLGIVGLGSWMIQAALGAIGVARALFLGEYQESPRRLVTRGIYGWLRHPLFVGGIVTSLGIGVFFFTSAPLSVAAANLAVLPAYLVLEDARCRKVYSSYGAYQREVGGVAPTAALTRRLARRVNGRVLAGGGTRPAQSPATTRSTSTIVGNSPDPP